MSAHPLLLALNSARRELYIGREQLSAKKPRVLKHWSEAAWRSARPIEGVPDRYTTTFISSFAQAYTNWGYRLILGQIYFRRPRRRS